MIRTWFGPKRKESKAKQRCCTARHYTPNRSQSICRFPFFFRGLDRGNRWFGGARQRFSSSRFGPEQQHGDGSGGAPLGLRQQAAAASRTDAVSSRRATLPPPGERRGSAAALLLTSRRPGTQQQAVRHLRFVRSHLGPVPAKGKRPLLPASVSVARACTLLSVDGYQRGRR